MKRIAIILFYCFICLLTGFIASKFQTSAIANWYPTLNKPMLTPPNIVFPIIWTSLYILIGIAGGLIATDKDRQNHNLLKIFFVQLILNFSWSISFFYLKNPQLGFINIISLDLVVMYFLVKSYCVNKVSFLLFIPYLLWILFATYLNYYIMVYN